MNLSIQYLLYLTALLPLAKTELPFPVICLIYLLGIILLVVELLVPGTFLGIVGVLVLVTSIGMAFYFHPGKPYYGISLLVISFIVVPSIFIWILRRITLASSQNLEDGYTSQKESLDALVGKEGFTITALRPSGMAKIENRRIDVTSENVMLEMNTPIKVVKIDGNRVVVRATGSPPKQED